MILKDKKIILGITGSIAAYKATYLLRFLVKEGADVQVIMTPNAKEFITPVTMSALSGKPVLGTFFENEDGTWHSHVDLGLWADLFLLAPASASTMGKMANGICDNLLLTTYLSAKCPVVIAPAMDLDMFKHPANLKNIDKLRAYGAHIIEPRTGVLASGLYGKGRMEEPDIIVEEVKKLFSKKTTLTGKKILVNAGPTYERIDPVRFIGNFSSGKMGYAIAEELAERGAEVTLVSGPVNIKTENTHIKVIHIFSAEEMYKNCMQVFPDCDGAVLSAAVADYTPVDRRDKKMKSGSDEMCISLISTHDIAKELGEVKKENQFLVGFALETDNALEYAKNKLIKKNLDFIVLNSLEDKGACFNVDTNKISIINKENKVEEFPLKDKKEVATDIVDRIFSI